eukprot:TRINITY_DN7653_c0_g1_i1.p2 TRINITY_DN7653_c0_g1~~TRINITY_DN7653_c0_g1_i1.p2  ORF type:complete len:105 (+),score=20.78 TRINITY_DN7653_c0_g1_i1:145-459(+)
MGNQASGMAAVGGNMTQQQQELMAMQAEMEFMSDMMYRMQDQCFRKCVTAFTDSDLSKGEATCVDRCVLKYMDFQQRIGIRLQAVQQQQMQQMQQMGQQFPGQQ